MTLESIKELAFRNKIKEKVKSEINIDKDYKNVLYKVARTTSKEFHERLIEEDKNDIFTKIDYDIMNNYLKRWYDLRVRMVNLNIESNEVLKERIYKDKSNFSVKTNLNFVYINNFLNDFNTNKRTYLNISRINLDSLREEMLKKLGEFDRKVFLNNNFNLNEFENLIDSYIDYSKSMKITLNNINKTDKDNFEKKSFFESEIEDRNNLVLNDILTETKISKFVSSADIYEDFGKYNEMFSNLDIFIKDAVLYLDPNRIICLKTYLDDLIKMNKDIISTKLKGNDLSLEKKSKELCTILEYNKFLIMKIDKFNIAYTSAIIDSILNTINQIIIYFENLMEVKDERDNDR